MDMAEYMRKRRSERIAAAREFLGGKCARCGATADLDFDHIDPSQKEDQLINLASRSLPKFWEEVVKCQLLCKSCHHAKTNQDNNWGGHGIGAYTRKKCRCDVCKSAWNSYIREYKRRKRVAV